MGISVDQSDESIPRKERRRSVRNSWQHLFQRWIIHRIPPAKNIVLNHHNIFILPNKQCLAFSLVLMLMLVGAINYEVRLAFALVYLLVGMAILSIFYTYRNLSGLEVSARSGAPVFAGEKLEVIVILNRAFKQVYESLQLSFKNSSSVTTSLLEEQEKRLSVFVPTQKRGTISPGRLTIETVFPFGICRSWSLLNLNIECLVYPKPISCEMDFSKSNSKSEGRNISGLVSGNDDFQGLREYHEGDSLQHVAWKNLARGQKMLTKQFGDTVDESIYLNWDMFEGFDIEGRLSRLCYCVLTLDEKGIEYGLLLPGINIKPSKGTQHYNLVLKELALYQLTKQKGDGSFGVSE